MPQRAQAISCVRMETSAAPPSAEPWCLEPAASWALAFSLPFIAVGSSRNKVQVLHLHASQTGGSTAPVLCRDDQNRVYYEIWNNYFTKNPHKHGRKDEQGRGEGLQEKQASLSLRWELRGGPAARAASPLGCQGAPGHPPSSAGILDKVLLKATEMLDTLLM